MARLLLIRRMNPLDFTLEEMRDLLEIRDRLASPRLAETTRAASVPVTEGCRARHRTGWIVASAAAQTPLP